MTQIFWSMSHYTNCCEFSLWIMKYLLASTLIYIACTMFLNRSFNLLTKSCANWQCHLMRIYHSCTLTSVTTRKMTLDVSMISVYCIEGCVDARGEDRKNRPVGHAHELRGWYRIFAIADLQHVTDLPGRFVIHMEYLAKRFLSDSKTLHKIILVRRKCHIYIKIIYIYNAIHYKDKKNMKI